jgi:opacity protein-like surface antigen
MMASSAYAFERQQHYLGVSGGVLLSSGGVDIDDGAHQIDFDSGVSLGLQYINYFQRAWRFHLGFSVHLGYSAADSEENDNAGTGTYTIMTSSASLGLGFNLKYEISQRLDLLADVGIGYFMNYFEEEYDDGSGIISDGDRYELTNNNIGYFFSIGANYLLTENIAIGLRVNHVINSFEGTNDWDENVKVDLGGTNILLILGIMF